MDPVLIHQISRDEGRSPVVYKDTKGLWTLGDGILVDPKVPGAGLRPEEMDYITANRCNIAFRDAVHIIGQDAFTTLSGPRQRVVINMCYNLGASKFAGFQKAIAFMRAGAFDKAADEMQSSQWFAEVGDRGTRLVKQMRTGVDQ